MSNRYPFWPYFDGNFVCFSNACSILELMAALQLELNKVGYTNFVKFLLQSISSKIKREFEKTNIPCISLNTNEITPILLTCLTSSWSFLRSTAGNLMILLRFWVVQEKKTITIASSWFQRKLKFSENSYF